MSLFDPPRKPEPADLPDGVVLARQTLGSVMRLAQDVAGLEDKQLAGALGIDLGQWSRIKSGGAHFPHDKLVEFMELVGNDYPLMWLAQRRGYELRRTQSSTDQRLAQKDAEIAELRREIETIKTFVRETR